MRILDPGSLPPRAAIAETLRLLNGSGASHLSWLGFSRAAEYTPQELQRGNLAFVKSVRALTDQWIDSGKDAGIEAPLSRSVYKLPPGYSEPLHEVLKAWLDRNPPEYDVLRTGEIAVFSKGPQLDRYASLELYARDCAIYWLNKELLERPAAHRIARCNNPACGRYYVRTRLRKVEIKRGTYCGKCPGAGSAERTRASRAARKRKLIERAASFWNTWKPTRRFGSRSKWVAKQMKAGLTGRWVSQNRAEIEAQVERRARAKR